MLEDRNLTGHVYPAELADRIFAAISGQYAAALADTVKRAATTLTL